MLCLAIFDAVLVHILHAVAPDSWQARARIQRAGVGSGYRELAGEQE